jgi:hypothetical protein
MEERASRTGVAGVEVRPVVKQVRLDARAAEELALLAREWRCSEGAAIRRAIHEKAVESTPRARRPRDFTLDELRAAAEGAREYYQTDAEAVEWADFIGDEPDDAAG